MWLWHLNSSLDLFCLGPWGWEGLVFWPLMYLKKSGYLYHCFFALILWLLLWGAFWCAELSFVHLLHGMSLWLIFVLGTNHPSCSLLCKLSWKQVIADQFIWKTCACWQLYRKFSILMRDTLPLLGGMDGIAAIVHFPLRPFLLEKNCIIIIHLSKEYSSHSAVSAFLMILTEVLGEDSSEPHSGNQLQLWFFATKQHPVSRISEKANLLSLQEKVRPSWVNPAKEGQCGEPTYASFVTCQCWAWYT